MSLSRSLRSSSSTANSKYWFEEDPDFKAQLRNASITDKENDAGVISVMNKIDSSVYREIAEKKSNKISGKGKGGGKIRPRKKNGITGVMKKQDIYMKKKVPEYAIECVVPSGSCKEIMISDEWKKSWEPISAQTLATVWKIISRATSVVKKDLSTTNDKRELSGVLARVKNELGLTLAPPTEPLSYVGSDFEDSLKTVPMEYNMPVEHNDSPLEHNDPPLERNDPPLERSDPPLERSDPPLEQSDLPQEHKENDVLLHDCRQEQPSGDMSSEASSAGISEWANETKENFIKYLLDLLQQERYS